MIASLQLPDLTIFISPRLLPLLLCPRFNEEVLQDIKNCDQSFAFWASIINLDKVRSLKSLMSYIKSEMKSKMRILHTLRINCVAVSGECQPSLRSLNRPTSLILCDWSLNIFIIHFKSGKMNEYTGMGALGIAVQTRGFYIFLSEEFNSCFSQFYYNDIITQNNTMWLGDMITQVFSHNIEMTGLGLQSMVVLHPKVV